VLTNSGYFEDTIELFENFPTVASIAKSPGALHRFELVTESRWSDISGPIYISLFESENLLLNNVTVDIELIRSLPEFVMYNQLIVGPPGLNTKYKIEIKNPTLTVRRYKPAAPFIASLVRSLEKSKVKYSYRNIDMKAINFSKELTRIAIPNVTTGQIPSRIIFGFVDSKSFKGNYQKNPFFFRHYNVKEINLYVNSNKHPSVPIIYDFGAGDVAQGFDFFIEQMGLYQSKTNSISKKTYISGFTFFAFDLTTDLSASEDHFSMIQNGDIFAEFNFANPLDQEVTCIIYTEYEKLIEVDGDRNIRTDDQIM
jgi:hypothetical protein